MALQLGQQTGPWGFSTWASPTWIVTTITETVTATSTSCPLSQASIASTSSQASLSAGNSPSYSYSGLSAAIASPAVSGSTIPGPGFPVIFTANGFVNYTPTTGSWTPWMTTSTFTTTVSPSINVTLTRTVIIPASIWPAPFRACSQYHQHHYRNLSRFRYLPLPCTRNLDCHMSCRPRTAFAHGYCRVRRASRKIDESRNA